MPLILAHDLGTTSNKATMFDEQGRLVAHHVEPYPVDYPQAGWAEQDPLDWWRAVETSTRTLLAKAQVHSSDIAAATFSGQMIGIVPIDAVGQPLRSAIIWADQRAVEEAETIGTRCGPEQVYRRTGHRVSPAYLAAKILGVKQHQRDRRWRAEPGLAANSSRWVRAADSPARSARRSLVVGAAVAGGIGVGVYAAWDIAQAHAVIQTVIDPMAANVALYADRLAVFADTYRAVEAVSMHNTGHDI